MAGMKNEYRARLALSRIRSAARDFLWLAEVPRVEKHNNEVVMHATDILLLVEALEEEIDEGRLKWRSRK